MRPSAGAPRAVRLAVLLAAITLLLAAASPVAAGRPTVEAVERGSFGCPMITTEAGSAFVEASVDEFGGFIGFALWETGSDPFEAPPTLEAVTFEVLVLDDTTLSATLGLGYFDEETTEPVVVETATLEATITVIGSELVDDEYQDGNVRVSELGTRELLSIDATVVTESYGTFAFSDCGGDRAQLLVRRTNPDAIRVRYGGLGVGCEFMTDEVQAFFFISDEFADAGIIVSGMEAAGVGDAQLTSRGGTASVPLFDAAGEPAGTATATFSLTPLDSVASRLTFSQGWSKATWETFEVSGTATFPGGLTFDMATCGAEAASFSDLITSPSGPKPGGKVPVNDLPENALAIVPGSRMQVQTGGTAFEAEIAPSCTEMVHTLWYEVTGTGNEITIDTAGSAIDTVLVVYDDEWNEVGCVDDVPIDGAPFFIRVTQAKITFATDEGATYYVQVGGFIGPAEFGRVRLTID